MINKKLMAMSHSDYGFVDLSDQKVLAQFQPYSKNTKSVDIRWDTCPPGQGFFVPVGPEEFAQGKKRPTVPQRYKGQYKTQAIKSDPRGQCGYLVSRFVRPLGTAQSQGQLPL
tara:strand:- start:104 stop:442 length:339 start_codon:yes stop_codon:yes gene_type:complete